MRRTCSGIFYSSCTERRLIAPQVSLGELRSSEDVLSRLLLMFEDRLGGLKRSSYTGAPYFSAMASAKLGMYTWWFRYETVCL